MEAHLRSVTSLLLLLLSSTLLLSPCHAADPDPLQDLCVAKLDASDVTLNGFPCKPSAEVVAGDFFFDGLTKAGSTNIFGSNVTAANVLAFAGLNTLGMSMNRVDLAPGGVNPPHSHPRATEHGIVLKGEVLVGFVTTGNVFYSKVLKAMENFVIPRGLTHFQYNVGQGNAIVITAFNSQLPGAEIAPLTLFGSNPAIPNGVLAKTLQVDEKVISEIKSKFGN